MDGRSKRRLSFPADHEAAEPLTCTLCNGRHINTSAPEDWRNSQAKQYATTLSLRPSSPVCRPCKDDIVRILKDSTITPRWKKKSGVSPCCISECDTPAVRFSKCITTKRYTYSLIILGDRRKPQKNLKEIDVTTSQMYLQTHTCDEVTTKSVVPNKWRENFINCRNCKRSLVIFLTQYFLYAAPKHMQLGQSLLIAGGFEGEIEDTAWVVKKGSEPQPDPRYSSNAEETDTRMWISVEKTVYTNVLIRSPDTDCYHIGMTMLGAQDKSVIVQLNKYSSKELRFLHLSNLIQVLKNDPDLSSLTPDRIPQIFQTLFVSTGCDYVSYFSGIGKATFYKHFFQNAEFIL